MAKSASRGAGPGTNERGGVRSTMSPAFGGGAGKGTQGGMNAPFDAGRSGGDNGLPTHVYDRTGGPGKAPAASNRDTPPRTSPRDQGNRRRY